MSWTYPTDPSAYFLAFVNKADGSNPTVVSLAKSKLTNGACNAVGTIVAQYDGSATPGVICKAYNLG